MSTQHTIDQLCADAKGLAHASARAADMGNKVACVHLAYAAAERLELARQLERMQKASAS